MTEPNKIQFSNAAGSKEMLRLNSEGFHYNGQVIKDAGEAYRLFREWLAVASVDVKPRQWQGLTDEDRESFWTADQMTSKEWRRLFDAVEAKLKEKNA